MGSAMPIHLPLGGGDSSELSVDLANLVVENAADSIFVMDTQGRTVFANPAAERTFGWTAEEMRGKILHDLVHHHHPDGRPFPMSECPLGDVFLKRQTLDKHEDVFFRRDGSVVHVACSNAPVLQGDEMIGAVLIAVDITDRKMMERKLGAALAAKEALIKEVHHRVKNSLMMVVGLLQLQGHQVADPDARRHFAEASGRVMAVARMHERLYRIEDVESVDFAEFLGELCREAIAAGPTMERILLDFDARPMVLPTDFALPLALLANELVTNALKHAFPGERTGRVEVRFAPAGDGWVLRVADDGVGLPDGVEERMPRSLGMRLVKTLAGQLGASLEVERTAGTAFILRAALPAA